MFFPFRSGRGELLTRWPKLRPRLLTALGLAAAISLVLGLTTPSAQAATHTAQTASPAAARTVWLCKPGMANDPCATSLQTTVVRASGATSVKTGNINTASKFDCFYIYPTVSTQSTANSNLVVQAAEIRAAKAQAAWFSTVCRVWAPMYRQATAKEILSPTITLTANSAPIKIAYQSLLAGFEDYLQHYNDGRPIIFVAHSQGSVMLIRLLQNLVDHNAALRHRVVLSIILAGNVVVPNGKLDGGTFSDLPVCTRTGETGCVIAYSSFPGEPPAASIFGRPGEGISNLTGQTATKGVHVVCVNPANMGGTATLAPYFLTSGTLPTPWVEYPGLYRASCQSRGGATWLEVAKATGPSDTRPLVTEKQGPNWGYHGDDVNLALGDLLRDTAAAEWTWTREQHWAA